jgi:hypothetical protein
MNNIINILKEVVDNGVYIVKFSSVIGINPTQNKLIIPACENLLWIRPCLVVKINGLDYKVISVAEDNSSIVVQGIQQAYIDPSLTDITLNKPTFVHGTVESSNIVISQDCIDMPIIYFYEMFESRKMPQDSVIEYIVNNARLFFVVDYDEENWLTPEFYENAINPMNNLVDFFIKGLKKNKAIEDEYILKTGYKTINRDKIGKTNNKKLQFDRFLSGVELIMNIPIKRINCKC